MNTITKDQKRRIHVIVAAIEIGDERYRQILAGDQYRAKSCTELSLEKASVLIEELEALGVKLGRWVRHNRGKYEDLGCRPGMASPAKLRKIEAMWHDVSIHKTDELRAQALRKLLFRLYGVSDLRFLENWQANKMLNTLAAMGRGNGSANEGNSKRFYPLYQAGKGGQ